MIGPGRDRGVGGIQYSVCTPAELSELIGLLSRTFAANDPPAVALGLTAEDLQVYLSTYSATAGDDGLTVLARDPESGDMAGALLAFDTTADPGSAYELSSRFEPIMDIFSRLETQVAPSLPTDPGEALSLLMLGVADAFARRGIAQELVRYCLAIGSQRGYRRALTIATNPVSQHIFGKLGFTTVATTSYADYRRDGVAVFASIADQGGPMLMTCDIAR